MCAILFKKTEKSENMRYSTDLTDKQWKIIDHIFVINKGQHI